MVEQASAPGAYATSPSASAVATREQERRTHVLERARELAATGRYLDWRRIEARLVVDGYPQARSVIEHPTVRAELEMLCKGVVAPSR